MILLEFLIYFSNRLQRYKKYFTFANFLPPPMEFLQLADIQYIKIAFFSFA